MKISFKELNKMSSEEIANMIENKAHANYIKLDNELVLSYQCRGCRGSQINLSLNKKTIYKNKKDVVKYLKENNIEINI